MRAAALRLAFVVCVTLTGFAVFLGRISSDRDATPRVAAAPRFHVVPPLMPASRGPRVLDVWTGDARPLRLTAPDLLIDCAVFSPWHDDRGGWQLIARWRRSTTSQRFADGSYCGLARYSYPGGRLIDQVACNRLPCGPPAWLPGVGSRVVFAAASGELYGYQFERPGVRTASAGPHPSRPRPLRWLCPRPTANSGSIWDVSCPTGLPGGPWLLVAVLHVTPATTGPSRSCDQIWWLRLDDEGRAVVASGQIFAAGPDGRPGGPARARHPRLSVTPGGGMTLAYLAESEGGRGWGVQVDAVELDPSLGGLRACAGATCLLADGALMTPPAFSPDGRWVHALLGTGDDDCRVVRLANPLAARGPVPSHPSRGETGRESVMAPSETGEGL